MDEQAARELEVVSHEMRTFLREDVERICREAMEMVNEVSMHLKCTELYKDKDGGLVAAEEGSMLFLESDDKTVVGSLRISDCHVHDFDVNVRFPKYNKGGNMQFTIAHKFTYTLRQIQDALHYIERAGGMLVHLPHLEGAGDPTWRELLPYMRKITKVCSDIVELLLKAVTELNDWSTRALPSLPQNWLRMEPALPSDLLLQAAPRARCSILTSFVADVPQRLHPHPPRLHPRHACQMPV
ncbi:hypothetical protein GUITHDRAFT_107257 [Guillardia theta CCMP2712]|uniref:Uncharacterized protein n=1 Tax=Guillardia theta (strain CCMP2712) TaxID=905079 RepID=L1JFI5_GUITC|nr:hypothetical protein GUITHDRAFT_107257 [Guillardia theta CCMP2712]EKX46904.1 hypothetical protein GUITHDRAFT_107257 [Guillardia theta CCMP2712]|eukprot:XP_005833884.1 hypothetical protein GUITHDRAFT_107257 [Guillardia theta CCMP2712]